MSGVDARVVATAALGRILRDGAWSNVVIRNEGRELSDADLAAAQSLTLGALRSLGLIDRAIADASRRPVTSLDPAVADLLRLAVHEVWTGDRPTPVVVDVWVRAAQRVNARAKGLVNAVLRRVGERPTKTASTAVERGVDPEVARMLTDAWGTEEAEKFWQASDEPALVGVRSTAPGATAQPVPGIEGAWWIPEGRAPAGVAIQDPASVAVGLAVGARRGETVLDVAAAPGGKTAHLLEMVGQGGMVVAADAHPRRVETARRRVPDARWVVADGIRPPFDEGSFDRVLLDAPCTGLGTLRRRPEIRFKVDRHEIKRLAKLQKELLERSLALVRPGGMLVYSVCTVTPAETVDLVAGMGARPPEGLPGRASGDGWLLGPHLTGTDGMFIALFDR